VAIFYAKIMQDLLYVFVQAKVKDK